jgi:hypothetical protein
MSEALVADYRERKRQRAGSTRGTVEVGRLNRGIHWHGQKTRQFHLYFCRPVEGLLCRKVRAVVEEDQGRSPLPFCETRASDPGKPPAARSHADVSATPFEPNGGSRVSINLRVVIRAIPRGRFCVESSGPLVTHFTRHFCFRQWSSLKASSPRANAAKIEAAGN